MSNEHDERDQFGLFTGEAPEKLGTNSANTNPEFLKDTHQLQAGIAQDRDTEEIVSPPGIRNFCVPGKLL